MAAKLSVIALALLGLLGAAGQPLAQQSDRSAAELMDAVMWNREPIGGPFVLIDQNGTRRTDADFRGKLMLVYFGFTFCPDVCPTDLMTIGQAIDKLGAAGDAVQPLFVTVDPERDTRELLASYVPAFDPSFLGLYGDMDVTAKTAREFRVFYQKQAGSTPSSYTLDHTAGSYVFDPQGRVRLFVRHGDGGATLVADLRTLLKQG
jgi:protein SCO1/2